MKKQKLKFEEVIATMDGMVLEVIQTKGEDGLARGYKIAEAYRQMDEMLTPEVMAPLMYLQGKKLGFCTDMDTNQDGTAGTGYAMEVVKRCVMDAVLMGLQVYGNQFNILGGKMYPTKEGVIYLLDKQTFLTYSIIPQPAKVVGVTAFVDILIEWTAFETHARITLPVAIHVGRGASHDSINGKAIRKGAAYILSKINGIQIPDGEVADTTPVKETGTARKRALKSDKKTGAVKKVEVML